MKNNIKSHRKSTITNVIATIAVLSSTIIISSCSKSESLPDLAKEPSWWDKLVKAITIEVDIKFGENTIVYGPNGPEVFECINSGLCGITVSGINPVGTKGKAYNVEGDFVIALQRGTFDESQIQNNQFIINEDKLISPEIVNSLGLSTGYTILANTYPVLDTGDSYIFIAFE